MAVLPIYLVTAGESSVIGASIWYTGVYVSLATLPLLTLCVLRFPQSRQPQPATLVEPLPIHNNEQAVPCSR
jgi:hypothetical protein